MSFPLVLDEPDPDYNPDDFDLSDNFNVLHISEIHAFEPENRQDRYKQHVGDQIAAYVQEYDIDRVSILGDTGSIEDVEEILEPVDNDTEIWIVAGDEDKKKVHVEDEPHNSRTGWFTQAQSAQPFDIENSYRIFDEGYETEIRGHTVQAAHHPRASKREDSLNLPDPRATNDSSEPETPEEIYEQRNSEDPIDKLFSVERDSNENTEYPDIADRNDADVILYDHVHMPYIRELYGMMVMGLGGQSHNYQTKADAMPLRSLQVTSFSKNLVHGIHFDAQKDDIFEHLVADFKDELDLYNVETPDSAIEGYLPLQSRFQNDQLNSGVYEEPDMWPESWSDRDKSGG